MECKLTSKVWNEALKQNKIIGLKCKDCGTVNVPPKMACHKCAGNNLEVTELKGSGVIQTFTTNNVAAEGRESEAPYTIVMVSLDEGPWLMGNMNIDPQKATMDIIGRKVKMSEAKVFCGDKYSAGEGARPIFSFVEGC